MSKLVPVDFACNDPDNGLPAMIVCRATIAGNIVEAPQDYAFCELDGKIRIHRKHFAFSDRKEWVGNWCWNRYWMTVKEANRLALHLREKGWRCTDGELRFFDWFNGLQKGNT